MWKDFRLLVVFIAIGLTASIATWAEQVDLATARKAVGNWAGRAEHKLGAAIGDRVKTARSHVTETGEIDFHIVQLEGGGFVVTVANDELDIDSPIIAFSGSADLIESRENPLYAMLTNNLGAISSNRCGESEKTGTSRAVNSRLRQAWDDLLTDGASDGKSGSTGDKTGATSSVADVRVAPLLKSTWSQGEIGSKRVYNYYTPYNYACGCTATAFSQVMRYHCYPTAPLDSRDCPITLFASYVECTKQTMPGVLDWEHMPLNPDSSISDIECRAIGKLTYNVGVTCKMNYRDTGSSASPGNAVAAAVDYFGYKSAKYYEDCSVSSDVLPNAVLSNLDAGYPVVMSIWGPNWGHAVVGDGYGYNGSVLYVHLNMGWGGLADVWYLLPKDSEGSLQIDFMTQICYNIFPDKDGEIISGRVFSHSGKVTSGIKVVAKNSSGEVVASDVSDELGVYALLVPSASRSGGSLSYNVSAIANGDNASLMVSVGKSENYSADVGNRWGQNLTLSDANECYYTICYSFGTSEQSMAVASEKSTYKYGEVHRIGQSADWSGFMGKKLVGWLCEKNGKRYDDGVLVFNLAEPGETVTMTAIWDGDQGGDSTLSRGLVACYPLNGNAKDFSVYGNHGTVYGATATADRYGNADSAMYFGGSSWICAPNISALANLSKSATVAAWVKFDEDSTAYNWYVLCRGETSCSLGLCAYNMSIATWSIDGRTDLMLTGTAAPKLGQWTHVAMTLGDGVLSLYVNGKLSASQNVGNDASLSSIGDAPLYIGKDPPSNVEYCKGALDEIRIYNRALSAEEIQMLAK